MQPGDCDDSPPQMSGNALKKNQVQDVHRHTANETKEELKLKVTTQIIIQENVVINEPQELKLKKTPQIMTQEKVVTNAQKDAKMTPNASDSKVLDEYTIFTQGLLKEGIDIKVDKPHNPLTIICIITKYAGFRQK